MWTSSSRRNPLRALMPFASADSSLQFSRVGEGLVLEKGCRGGNFKMDWHPGRVWASKITPKCMISAQMYAQISPADETLVYASVLNMTNIPFKDCFTVNTAWVVRPMPGGLCRFSAYLKVGD